MKKIPVRHMDTLKEPGLSGGFSIRDLEMLLDGKDMVQELHRHDFFYLLALKKGSGNHSVDFVQHDIVDHAVFIMRPGQVHQLELKAGSTGYLMQFRTDFYQPGDKPSTQLLRRACSVNHYRFDAAVFGELLAVLDNVHHEYTDHKQHYQEAIRSHLSVFFIGLARQAGNCFSGKINLYMQERLEAFLELLETHVYEHKQVAEYAAMMNLSVYQLNAITKAALGKTCSDLISEYMILEAKRYLLATSDQVGQVADRLGYEDASYFTRFFKKHTSYSPEAFRQNFR